MKEAMEIANTKELLAFLGRKLETVLEPPATTRSVPAAAPVAAPLAPPARH
jgi:hypothetical protein